MTMTMAGTTNETAPLTVSVLEAVRLTGLSRSTLYRLIDQSRLRRLKVGGRTLIRFCDLQDFIDSCVQQDKDAADLLVSRAVS